MLLPQYISYKPKCYNKCDFTSCVCQDNATWGIHHEHKGK